LSSFSSSIQSCSLLCYATKAEKKKKTEEEGDDNCRHLLREATLSEEREEGDDNIATVASFAAL